MNYFFGNARNDKGLCATPDCIGRPVHTIVFKYCTRCYDAIMEDLAFGRVPNIEQIENPNSDSRVSPADSSVAG